MEPAEFQKILADLRRRDERAAEAFVRQYEPLIRRVVRGHLTDPGLRRVVDSLDICQSILTHFLALADRDDFRPESPRHLRNLLVKMARNKLIDRARHERRHAGSLPDGWEPAAADAAPGDLAERHDLAAAVLDLLTPRERWLVEQHALGRGWVEMAGETGENPSALRVMHARALARVRRQLGT